MLLVYVLLVAILIGYLLGGSLRNYSEHPLRFVLLPCAAFMVEASFGMLSGLLKYPPSVWLKYVVCLEYLLLALFIWFNLKRRGMLLMWLSTLLNFIVIASNGFRMPVSPLVYHNPSLATLVERIQSGELMEYVLVGWDGPLWFLGDTIPMFNGLASIGDLLMAAALLVIILDIMLPNDIRKVPNQ